MKKNLLPLTTPGEVLDEEFLAPNFAISAGQGYSYFGPAHNEIVHGQRAITPDTALRLGKYFGVSAQFWLNLQARYDLQQAERKADFLIHIQPLRSLGSLILNASAGVGLSINAFTSGRIFCAARRS